MSFLLSIAALSTLTVTPVVSERVDPITDAHSVWAIFGNQGANLAVGCADAKDAETVQVIVHFNEYMGEARPGILAGGRELLYRFDQRPPQSVLWYADNRDVYALSKPTRPVKFILEMKGSTTLHLRALAGTGEEANLAFAYAEPSKLIDEVLAKCGFGADGRKLKR